MKVTASKKKRNEDLKVGAGLDKLADMFTEYMRTMDADPSAAICPPPEAPCKKGDYLGWFGLNALAYGFKKGVEAAGSSL